MRTVPSETRSCDRGSRRFGAVDRLGLDSESGHVVQVEGDVLLLSDDRRAVAPRVPQPVDMAKQLGRDTVDHDDFEELVLSPKRPMRRTSCFVDMAKARMDDLK